MKVRGKLWIGGHTFMVGTRVAPDADLLSFASQLGPPSTREIVPQGGYAKALTDRCVNGAAAGLRVPSP